jgi:alkyl hydroperoxide reductase subunit D
MSIQTLRDHLPDYARDMKLNLGSLLSEEGAPGLTMRQIYGTLLASAYATKNQPLISAVQSDSITHLSEADITGAKAAATIMAMNNIYYRSLDLLHDEEFKKMPANLRMNIIREPGISKEDFEIYSLAVSAVNGCEMCLNAHAEGLKKLGVSRQAIQSAIRIAAVVHSVAQVMTIESQEPSHHALAAA